jgi:hypothetical protein
MKWLEPPFLQTMERLGHEGVKEMLVVPISFVTEHIETLHEINIDGRIDAKKYGIERFRMMPASRRFSRVHWRSERSGAAEAGNLRRKSRAARRGLSSQAVNCWSIISCGNSNRDLCLSSRSTSFRGICGALDGPLFCAGALVTSNAAALSVPDWPKSFGTWFPSLRQPGWAEHSLNIRIA